MFKVECPGCQAPYQVDERRVPVTGLGMRCPKCGTSFTVSRPGAMPGAAAAPVTSSGPAPTPADLARAVPRTGALAGTMMGTAPQRKPSAPKMTASDASKQLAALSDDAFDLPDLPSPAGPGRGVAGAASVGPPSSEMGLPATRESSVARVLSGLPNRQDEIGLPAARGPDLSAPRPSLSAEPMFDEADFKVPQGLSVLPGQSGSLPAVARGTSSAGLPAVGSPAAGSPAGGVQRPNANLPAVPFPNLPMPSPPGGGNLPATSSPNLPATSSPNLPATGGNLPATPSPNLPASGGNLPTTGGNLPDFSVSLPALGDGLPSFSPDPMGSAGGPTATVSDYSPPEFEVPDGTRRSAGHSDDPFAAGAEPFDSDDPFANPPGDPFASAQDPLRTASSADPFAPPGTVVYPNTSGNPPPEHDPFDVAHATEQELQHRSAFDTGHSQAPVFGTEADPFAGAAGHMPDPFASGSERSAFDTTGGEAPFAVVPSVDDPFMGAERSAFDTAAGIGSLPPTSVPPPVMSQAPSADAADGESGGVKRLGGADYGEVDLGGGESDSVFGSAPVADDGMEFGGVPQEETAAPAPGDATISSLHTRMAIGAMPEIETDRQRRRKQRIRIGVAVTFVVLVSGGALTLLPKVGPFGSYFIMDRINQRSHQQLLMQTAKRLGEIRGLDVFKEVQPLVDGAVHTAEQVPRFKAFGAYAAFARYWAALRFGPLPEMESKAKVLLNELEQEKGLEKLNLALAAQAIVDGNLARARELLGGIRGGDKDGDVLSLKGELELRARDYEKAEQIWTSFFEMAPTAQAAYGLARVVLMRGDKKRALELSTKAIELSPGHLDARILIARLMWDQNDEAKALEALKFITDRGAEASPGVLVAARTWFGNIHLIRGRISQAEKEYDEALKLNSRSAEALRGLGDTLYAAGRFNEALARFGSALEAESDSLTAAVGVGKAKLALERLEEAKSDLAKLYEAHPSDMNVAYWFGRVEEALGNKEPARAAYIKAIEVGGQRAESAKAYIALASLQSQLGDVEGANATLAGAQQKLPESPELHKAMGNLALEHGRFEAAMEDFSKALTLDSKDIEARFLMGTTKRRMRVFEDALTIFDEITKIDAAYPGVALERGLLFEEWGRIEDALKEYEAALAKAPTDVDVMLRVGCARVGAGHGERAEEILRKVLSMRNAQPAESAHCLGRALLLKGDLHEAIRLLSRAVDLAPKRAEYHMYLGWAFNEQGRLADAETSLKKALDLDQGLADAFWQRGILRHKQKALPLAIEDLNYALKLRPSRVEAHAQLAGVYYDQGQVQRSLAEWSIATKGKPNNMLWRFRYGKMLGENLRIAEAITELGAALEMAQKVDPPPPWLWQAHLSMARALGMTPNAVNHWKAYYDQAPTDSPYRDEARKACAAMGQPIRD